MPPKQKRRRVDTSTRDKLLILNKLRLPSEVVDVVKGFAFQDIVKATAKSITKNAVALLRMASSRFSEPDYETTETWVFEVERLRLRASNCGWCGGYNYYNNGNSHSFNEKITCSCFV